MATLYLVRQGTTLSQEGQRFVATVPDAPPAGQRVEVLIREVERILVFGQVQVTTRVIGTCLAAGIPVVYLSQVGEYKGHLWSAETADVALQVAQFERRQDPEFGLAIARALVAGKVDNSRQLLLRLNRKRKQPQLTTAIAALLQDLNHIRVASDRGKLLGYEGVAAARYFAALGQCFSDPGFTWTGRSFHPPPDPLNSLLSFGYTLLLSNMFSLVVAAGLNPYLGHIHGTERQRPDLVLDLMEEFRSPIVDSAVVQAVNQRRFAPTDFGWPTEEEGVYLEEPARRRFLQMFEDRITTTTRHPDVQAEVTYRRAMELQVQRYGRSLLGNQPYQPFRREI
jgi:CRISPR-associated protein Cas1